MKQSGGTVIKLRNKRGSIGSKLFRNNLIMLVAILIIFLASFNLIFRSYLYNQSQNALDEQAKSIMNTLAEMNPPLGVEREEVVRGMFRRNLQLIGNLVDTEIIFWMIEK